MTWLAGSPLFARGGAATLNVADVFSTDLYTGNGSTQTITNGIDLAGKGGLVWVGNRSTGSSGHVLVDSLRGIRKQLFSNLTNAENTGTQSFSTLGGLISNVTDSDVDYQIHTFSSNGTFTVFSPGTVEYLIVAGGGSGGSFEGGGGGAGGLILGSTQVNAGEYPVTVGPGGESIPAGVSGRGFNGSNSSAFGFTAIGGGGGGAGSGTSGPGQPGGSGGGGAGNSGGFTNQPGTGTSGQGNNGGIGTLTFNGGGGGGAGSVGGDAVSGTSGGDGGDGLQISITGTPTYYAGGGGGMSNNGDAAAGTGGLGGGGGGSESTNGVAGINGLGGGGGGCRGVHASGAGGSGVVIIRYTPDVVGANAFNSNGFSTGSNQNVNFGSRTYVAWTFRDAPRFFTKVTYTGNGTAGRTIAHNLGVVPGMIVVKRLDAASDWQVLHRSLANTQYLVLNSTAAVATGTDRWNSTTPTDSVFTLGSNAAVNISGGTYVAFVIAHDPDPSGVIHCGSYTGNGSATGPVITLGWEPQWLMIKRSDSTGDWWIYDNERDASNPRTFKILANSNAAEDTAGEDLDFLTTVFQPKTTATGINASGGTYVFAAIRAEGT